MSWSSTSKSVDVLLSQCKRRYTRVWADELLAPGCTGWPYSIRVGRPSQRDLEREYARVSAQNQEVVAWAVRQGLSTATESRKVGRMSYPVLSHVVVPSMEALAYAVGQEAHWRLFFERARVLREAFPQVGDGALRDVLVQLSRVNATSADFELVCTAAQWFTHHDTCGLTPREVPLEGFHAKWLDSAGHRSMVCALAGIDSLELRERPRLVRFHYLDPAYLATGAREHDTWLEGDRGGPAYEPSVVIICENRDSALWFLPMEGAIAILGDGMAGVPTLANVAWISSAPTILYWGDIDVHGFRILAAYREHGLDVRSVLMDRATYTAYERFGTSVDAHGRLLQAQDGSRPLPWLTKEENSLYLELCSSEHEGVRRIEQERIPLAVARAACEEATCTP